jgi:glycosyltransferase involved in cell wall biosynthesis
VTVLIPAYNAAKFIQTCIQSLLQSDQGCAYSILVVDDGSTDHTPDLLQALQTTTTVYGVSMQVLTLPKHQGLVSALDAGLRTITTEFIARLDADDICLPNRLNRQLIYLRANPAIHVLGMQAMLWVADEEETVSNSAVITCMKTHPLMGLQAMCFRCPLLHPSVMYRRQSILDAGGYSGNGDVGGEQHWVRSYVEDYDLWMRVAARHPYGVANLPDVGIQLRLHEQSKSRREQGQSHAASRYLRFHFLSDLLLQAGRNIPVDLEASLHIITHPHSQLTCLDQLTAAFSALESIYAALHDRWFIPYFDTCYELKESEQAKIVWKCMELVKAEQVKAIVIAAIDRWGGQKARAVIDGQYLCLVDDVSTHWLKNSIWRHFV